jgi:hypothetical protein
LKALGLTLLVIFAALMLYGESGLPDRGDLDAPANRLVTPYYIVNAYSDVGAPNMVTVVLVDYRGFDTLGETVVILAAGLAVLLILRTSYPGPEPDIRRRGRERKIEGGLGQADLDDEGGRASGRRVDQPYRPGPPGATARGQPGAGEDSPGPEGPGVA